jgi:hypothetical protein
LRNLNPSPIGTKAPLPTSEEGAEWHAMEEKRWWPLIALITCSYWWRNEGVTVFLSSVMQEVNKMLA